MKQKLMNAKTKMSNYVMMKMAGVNPAKEDGDHLVEVLGTIIIAVVILIFFKDMIADMFNNMMNQTESKVNQLFTNVVTTNP